MIPYGRQQIDEHDIQAVVDILRSDYLTQGPLVPAFENELAGYVGAAHAVAVNSATSALHLACLSLDVGPGDVVWTSPITFVASANCALYCGADVDFVDVDPNTYNISVQALADKLLQAKAKGCLPKVVIPVHLCGQSCDMRSIHALSRQYGFRIIEDASHAIGSKYRSEPVGCCRYSDITIFSFHPVKIITSGEGGVAMTNDDVLVGRMRLLRNHGITRDAVRMTREPDGPWYYQQVDLGFNYRMTDIHAALGLSQLRRLDAFIESRQTIARHYDGLLTDLPVSAQLQLEDTYSSFHLYVVRIDPEQMARTRREVFEYMRANGVGVNVHYIPVHLQPYYARLGFRAGDFPAAEAYYAQAITLPIYPGLTTKQQDYIVSTLADAVAST